jgi:4'-phosphopantetheinyl transferase
MRWLTRSATDVPPGDDWLSRRERAVQAALRIDKRRDDWRLGRFAAKAVVSRTCAVAPARVEVIAAADGAPEVYVDGVPVGLSLSLSHRAGRALAVVGEGRVGCDLEWVEPRSRAFTEDWLAPSEQAWAGGDPLRVNLAWTAKEAAAKVRREGLRLDVRSAVATPAPGDGPWQPLTVDWGTRRTAGWWRAEDGWVMAVAAEPAAGPPEPC